jgi:hypothetical protein
MRIGQRCYILKKGVTSPINTLSREPLDKNPKLLCRMWRDNKAGRPYYGVQFKKDSWLGMPVPQDDEGEIH